MDLTNQLQQQFEELKAERKRQTAVFEERTNQQRAEAEARNKQRSKEISENAERNKAMQKERYAAMKNNLDFNKEYTIWLFTHI